VPATQELLVLRLMTASAVGGGHVLGNDEPMMIRLGLVLRGLMALQAVDAFDGVGAQFVRSAAGCGTPRTCRSRAPWPPSSRSCRWSVAAD
jgi:hypothetical protein